MSRLLSFGSAESEEPISNESDAGNWWLLRLGDDPKVRLGCLPAIRVFLFGFFVRHGRHDDHILAMLPVHRSCDVVGRRELYRIEDPQNFVKVTACAHRVNEHQFDLLVRADQEHGAYRGVVHGRTTLGSGSRIGRQHVIDFCDFEFRVADQRVVHSVALSLFYVHCPLSVTAYRVDAQPDNLAVSLREFRLQPGHVAEFGGANGSKVFWVRKQDRPSVSDPFVEVDGPLCGLSGKIGGFVINAQTHGYLREGVSSFWDAPSVYRKLPES